MSSRAGTFLSSSSSRSSAPGTAVAGALPAPSHFQKTSLSFRVPSTDGVHETRGFSNSTVSYVGNLFTSRTPRRSQSSFFFFKKRSRGKLRAAFSYYIHRPSANGQQIFPGAAGLSGRLLPAPPLPAQRRCRPAATRRSPQARRHGRACVRRPRLLRPSSS